jgi:hypothetical protein
MTSRSTPATPAHATGAATGANSEDLPAQAAGWEQGFVAVQAAFMRSSIGSVGSHILLVNGGRGFHGSSMQINVPLVALFLQSLSSLAIAAGVIFAASQLRQNRRAAHVSNFTKLVEMQLQLRRMRVDNPALAKVYRHDVMALQSDDEIREYFFNLMQLSVFEIVWFSYRQGQIPYDYFLSWDRRMREIAREDSFRKMMHSGQMKILHDDFQAYVVKMLGEVEYGMGERSRPGPIASAKDGR